MLIDRWINDGSEPVLEQVLRFTAARHRLIAENVVNISTPGYRQKDVSLELRRQFQTIETALKERL